MTTSNPLYKDSRQETVPLQILMTTSNPLYRISRQKKPIFKYSWQQVTLVQNYTKVKEHPSLQILMTACNPLCKDSRQETVPSSSTHDNK